MMVSTVLLISTVVHWLIANNVKGSSDYYYYDLSYDGTGGGTTCKGSGEITQDGLNLEVSYDASGIFNEEYVK